MRDRVACLFFCALGICVPVLVVGSLLTEWRPFSRSYPWLAYPLFAVGMVIALLNAHLSLVRPLLHRRRGTATPLRRVSGIPLVGNVAVFALLLAPPSPWFSAAVGLQALLDTGGLHYFIVATWRPCRVSLPMFRHLFSRKSRESEPTLFVARMNDRAMPLDRGELYEDPLEELLDTRGWGHVSGGGTQQGESGEIEFCDVELSLTNASVEVLDAIVRKLDELGAPRGSQLLAADSDSGRQFGRAEGLALYLNGTDLPKSTYQECDSNFVYSECNRLLRGIGKVHSHWQGPTETALYMYGTSYDAMRSAIAPLLESYPLCARARVAQVA